MRVDEVGQPFPASPGFQHSVRNRSRRVHVEGIEAEPERRIVRNFELSGVDAVQSPSTCQVESALDGAEIVGGNIVQPGRVLYADDLAKSGRRGQDQAAALTTAEIDE